MKATDRQLINISEELTAHIITPKGNLNLSRDECIILNGLISEEFERREEQDVMGSSNGQDTPLGQTGADNNDVALDASECRNNEVSGTSLREKKKPQITKVSKKEYWDNMDKHGVYELYDMSDEPESRFGKEPYEEREVPYLGFMPYPDEHIPVAWMHREVQKNFMLKPLFYSILSDWDFDADKYEAKGMALVLYPKWLYIPLSYIIEKGKDPLSNSRYQTLIDYWKQDRYMWTEYRPEPKPYVPKPLKWEEWDKVNINETTEETPIFPEGSHNGAISIDIYKLFGHSFDDKSLNFGGMPLLDKYIPIAWMEERIRVNKNFPCSICSTSFKGYDAVYQSVIDSWESFGRDDWYKDVHDESC